MPYAYRGVFFCTFYLEVINNFVWFTITFRTCWWNPAHKKHSLWYHATGAATLFSG